MFYTFNSEIIIDSPEVSLKNVHTVVPHILHTVPPNGNFINCTTSKSGDTGIKPRDTKPGIILRAHSDFISLYALVYGVGQEGLPFPSPGDIPDPGMEPTSPAGEFFTTKSPGKPSR